MGKRRLSASVDEELLDLGQEAVRDGRAATMSEWVNRALQLMVRNDRLLANMDTFIAGYEAEHGEITEEDMDEALRHYSENAINVRRSTSPGPLPTGSGPRRRRPGAA